MPLVGKTVVMHSPTQHGLPLGRQGSQLWPPSPQAVRDEEVPSRDAASAAALRGRLPPRACHACSKDPDSGLKLAERMPVRESQVGQRAVPRTLSPCDSESPNPQTERHGGYVRGWLAGMWEGGTHLSKPTTEDSQREGGEQTSHRGTSESEQGP